ncbi:MAG: Clp protease, partial [Hyphomicrobium sp.]
LLRDLNRDTLAHQDDQGRTHAVLLDRIGTLESVLRDGSGTVVSGEPSLLVAKLEGIENSLEQRLQDMSNAWAVLSTRLQELESAVRNQPVSVAGGAGLDDIRQAFDLKPIADRLDVIEEAVLGGDQRGFSDIGDRLSRLEDGIGQVLATPTGDGSSGVLAGGLDRIEGLAGKIDANHGSLAELLVNLTDRVSDVERAVAAEIETAAAKHQAYTQDLTEVHEALLKVNGNQHTLAGSMDQWRSESATDVATIMNRLAAIDRDTALPAETLSALNDHMDAMNRFIIERYHRRHRFMYWLFGTDDWMSASWPSTKAKIDADQHRLKVVGQPET